MEINVRGLSPEESRQQVRDELDAVEATTTIVADHDVEPALYQYEILTAEPLDWEYETEGPETWEVGVTKTTDTNHADLIEFDVRELPPQKRHEVLLETFEMLDPGDGFVLVNDHDPKPLSHELRSIHGDVFEWEYRSRDPQAWNVEIIKTDTGESNDTAVAATFDVREIPKQERHPTIHHRYGNIEPGDAMEIIAPHEPRPLRREFQQRYGDTFEWEVLDKEAGRCRVRITKGDPSSSTANSETPSRPSQEPLTVTEELDVRDRPPAERHELIFERYDELDSGEAFVLVNDHDPKPLYHQFDAEAGDDFRWEYQQKEPGEFEVLVGKADVADSELTDHHTTEAPF
jgi:uncharacterized protein (DUF2249 family)